VPPDSSPPPGRANAGKPNSHAEVGIWHAAASAAGAEDCRPGKRRDKQQRASMVGSKARLRACSGLAVICPRQGSRPRRRVLLRSCPARRLPDPGPGHQPWTGPLEGEGRGGRACWGQAPEQRRSAWPRAKLGATSSTARTKHNTTAGRLLTTLRSLTVIHIQPPGSGVATSEAHPS
jgi:hypothetical protein